MKSIVFSALLAAVAAIFVNLAPVAAQTGAAGAAGADAFLGSLSRAAQARLTDPQETAAGLAEHGRVRVIVEFAEVVLPPGVGRASADADAAMIAHARSGQDRILERVLPGGAARAAGDERFAFNRMTYSPMFVISADAELLKALADDPEVVRIHPDRIESFHLNESLPLIGVPAAIAAGGTGQGQVVAILDSGSLIQHEFLTSRIVAGACFNAFDVNQGVFTRCPNGQAVDTSLAAGTDCTNTSVSGCGHGTHVAGTAAGFIASPAPGRPPHGVSRNARIMAINIGSFVPENNVIAPLTQNVIAGLEHVYAQRNNFTFAAVNMSLGGGQHSVACPNEARAPIIRQLVAAGIAVIASAGNNGYDNSVGAPACIPEAWAIGSSTKTDVRSSFSNWGSLVVLTAPGSDIFASYVDGASTNTYDFSSGTSMSAPHVAGAVAAIRSAVPQATVAQMLAALRDTGTPVTAAGRTVPRINVDAAIRRLQGGGAAPTTTTLTGPSTSALGQAVTFTATVTSNAGTPTGTVEFRRGGTPIGNGTLNAAGSASFTTSQLPAGAHQITARYVGTAAFEPSTSQPLTHTVGGGGQRPPNDDLADATRINQPGTVTGSNVGATRQNGEPPALGSTAHTTSVWWRFTPAASGRITIDTNGSNFDTILSVFTGAVLTSLSLVVEDDDGGEGTASRVQFDGVAGTDYAIRVTGYTGATGNVTLRVQAPGGGGGNQDTTTSLTGPSSGTEGQTLTYTATVRATTGTPTGRVEFRRGGTAFGSATLSGGTASVNVSNFPVGTHDITAHYLGATGFNPSASGPLRVTISGGSTGRTLFAGGGSVFNFADACRPNWPMSASPVTVTYWPSEANSGNTSEVTLTWRQGSVSLSISGPFTPGPSYTRGVGRFIWGVYASQTNRPQIRMVWRLITRPVGGTGLGSAEQVMIRMIVRNFGNIPNCTATIAATLTRSP